MMPELGIIEGFYGRPWSWDARAETVSFLAPYGFRFYLYAPKFDQHLRRKWKVPYPKDLADRLVSLSSHCRQSGVRFGIGLTPYELYAIDDESKAALADKLSFFDSIGVEDLGILFDDMRGDAPDLAKNQVAIVDFAASRTKASRIIVCPSYYSDDPVLDRVFGNRPANYLEDLGAGIDSRIEMFWTGEEVISRQFTRGHLERTTNQMGRKPFLWDNYPVNDGQRMSQYLHLRGFTGRPGSNADAIAGHGVNPAVQPTLNRIPCMTLSDSYRLGDSYQYSESFRHACHDVLGRDLGEMVREDLLTLQDIGLDRLGEKEKALRERYGNSDHPGAKEIISWLDGAYRITDEIVQTG